VIWILASLFLEHSVFVNLLELRVNRTQKYPTELQACAAAGQCTVCCVWQVKDYDFVMDDEIEFVQALPMAGTLSEKVSDMYVILSVCLLVRLSYKQVKKDYSKMQNSKFSVSQKTSPTFLAVTRESIVGFW